MCVGNLALLNSLKLWKRWNRNCSTQAVTFLLIQPFFTFTHKEPTVSFFIICSRSKQSISNNTEPLGSADSAGVHHSVLWECGARLLSLCLVGAPQPRAAFFSSSAKYGKTNQSMLRVRDWLQLGCLWNRWMVTWELCVRNLFLRTRFLGCKIIHISNVCICIYTLKEAHDPSFDVTCQLPKLVLVWLFSDLPHIVVNAYISHMPHWELNPWLSQC